MKNYLGLRCRVCGVVDDEPGHDLLEPDAYDLEWMHYACEDRTAPPRLQRIPTPRV